MEQRRQGKHVPCRSYPLTRDMITHFFFALPEVGDLLCCGQRASIFEQLKLHIPLTPAHLPKIIEALRQLTFSPRFSKSTTSTSRPPMHPAEFFWVNLFFLVFLTILSKGWICSYKHWQREMEIVLNGWRNGLKMLPCIRQFLKLQEFFFHNRENIPKMPRSTRCLPEWIWFNHTSTKIQWSRKLGAWWINIITILPDYFSRIQPFPIITIVVLSSKMTDLSVWYRSLTYCFSSNSKWTYLEIHQFR
jgi:hypothetical protein